MLECQLEPSDADSDHFLFLPVWHVVPPLSTIPAILKDSATKGTQFEDFERLTATRL